ncbi:NADH:ubiquinone oxidoreductase subunit V3 [Bombus fervidus]|uniref:NADH:ubiquinone oxidoreductase subunit V3 n=1 Tax=Bombus fervidus TaxID=203811 RepID=UPI003AB87652
MLRLHLNDLLKQKQNLILLRYLSSQAKSKSQVKSKSSKINPNIVGLSEKCCKIPNTPVGPRAAKDKEYKNPEYFCYHIDTFGEAEVELAKYRLPAPSNRIPFNK